MENDSTKGFTMVLKALHKGSKQEDLIQRVCPSPEQNQALWRGFALSALNPRL